MSVDIGSATVHLIGRGCTETEPCFCCGDERCAGCSFFLTAMQNRSAPVLDSLQRDVGEGYGFADSPAEVRIRLVKGYRRSAPSVGAMPRRGSADGFIPNAISAPLRNSEVSPGPWKNR